MSSNFIYKRKEIFIQLSTHSLAYKPLCLKIFCILFYNLDICSQICWTKCSPRWLKYLEGGNAESVLLTASTPQLFADTLRQSIWQILSTVVKSVGNFALLQMHSKGIKKPIYWKIIKMIMKWKWINTCHKLWNHALLLCE